MALIKKPIRKIYLILASLVGVFLALMGGLSLKSPNNLSQLETKAKKVFNLSSQSAKADIPGCSACGGGCGCGACCGCGSSASSSASSASGGGTASGSF